MKKQSLICALALAIVACFGGCAQNEAATSVAGVSDEAVVTATEAAARETQAQETTEAEPQSEASGKIVGFISAPSENGEPGELIPVTESEKIIVNVECPTDRRAEDYADFLDGACLPSESCAEDFDLLNTYDPHEYGSVQSIVSAPEGSDVFAVQDGTVELAQWNYGYGYCVVIDHGNGIKTYYNHLSAFNCEVGDKVAAGDVIGYSGHTGQIAGDYLGYVLEEG